jgi:rhamnosyltransferase subunit B
VATILFAQELGAGLGHINKLAAIAAHLREHRIVFVLREPALGIGAVSALGENIVLRASEAWRFDEPRSAASPATMADVLHDLGFADPAALRRAGEFWDGVLDAERPDLIVSDFSPGLRMMATGRVPMVAVGNGFTIPPDLHPLPRIAGSPRAAPPASAAADAAVLAAVNVLRARSAASPLASAAALFRGDETFVSVLPLLDPYRDIREDLVGVPFNIPAVKAGAPAGQRRGIAIFCYVGAEWPGVNVLLTALNGLAAPSEIFVRGIDPRKLAPHCAPQVGIHPVPADFRDVLPRVRLCVHNGSLGIASAGLLAGTPQLALTSTLEQEQIAHALAANGCGVGAHVGNGADAAELRSLIEAMLGDAALQARAAVLARKTQQQLAALDADPVLTITQTCRRLLERG